MRSLPFRTLYCLTSITALVSILAFSPDCAEAQVIKGEGGTLKEALQGLFKSGATARKPTNRTLLAALAESKKYTVFLEIVERADMTAFLKGTATDSTNPAITFVEDSVKSPASVSTANIKVEGEVPEGVDVTDIKSNMADQMRDAMGELMTEIIAESGRITVFAPNDAAFAKLPKATLDSLKNDAAAAKAFVKAHTVNRGIYRDAFGKIRTMTSLSGTQLSMGAKSRTVATINGITVAEADVAGDNGVAHGLEAVLDKKGAPTATSDKK